MELDTLTNIWDAISSNASAFASFVYTDGDFFPIVALPIPMNENGSTGRS